MPEPAHPMLELSLIYRNMSILVSACVVFQPFRRV